MSAVRRAAAVAAAAATLLAGCSRDGGDEGSDAPTPVATLTALDESLTVAVPEDWQVREDAQGNPVVVAASGPAPGQELRVSRYDDPAGAEEAAIRNAGVLSGRNVFCERLDDTEVLGDPHLVFDCPIERPGRATRRQVFVVLVHGGESALVGVQTDAETLDEAADLLGPVVDSLSWQG